MTTKRIAIVTGASAGLGAEYALEVEKQFSIDEVWLIARRRDSLEKIAAKLERSKGICLGYDLTNPRDLEALTTKIDTEKPEIRVLINNAGFGKIGSFAELDRKAQLQSIDLNVRALTEITHMSLPYMTKGSQIIQVASSISFAPSPRLAVYAATKAYVLSFSWALRVELRKAGIQVIAVCPGPVETEFLDVALAHNPRQKPGTHRALAAHPKAVVDLSFYDLKRGRAVSIYSWPVRLFVWAANCLPTPVFIRLLAMLR